MSYGPLGHVLERRRTSVLFWRLVVASESGNLIASKSKIASGVGKVVTARQIRAPMSLLFSIPISRRSLLFGGNTAWEILLRSITMGILAEHSRTRLFGSVLVPLNGGPRRVGYLSSPSWHVLRSIRIAFLIMRTSELRNVCIFYQ